MGNTESLLNKQFSNEELARSAKTDAEILAALHDISFDDSLIVQQYTSELESNIKQFQSDEDELSRRKNLKEKWNNAELALAVLDSTKSSHFQKKELKYLRKEIQTSRDKGIGNFQHVLNMRLLGIEKIHAAMIRTHKRLKKGKSKLSSDLEIQKKADFVMNLFSNSSDPISGKLMDHVLSRVSELPSYQEMTLGNDGSSEKEVTEEEQSASMETEENSNKNPAFPDFQIGDSDSVRTYEEQFSKSLMHMIINTLCEDSKQQLGKLNSFSPAQDMSASTSATAPMKLMQNLQRNLLHKAACSMRSADSEPLWTLLFYAKTLLQACVDILSLAIKVNKSLTNTDSQSMDRRVDMRVQFLMKSSIVYHLAFPFCTALCILLNMPEFTKFAVEVLPIMVVLISLVDTVNTYHGESQSAEKYYLERLKLAENARAVEVESPHNYYPNTDEDKTVHIQGATHLTVTFDPRSSTQVGNDFLQLYKQEKRVEPILDAFSGKPENWPRVPLLIQGDTVCFHFHSEAFGSFWGYRCIVTPYILDSSKVWLYDFERTLGFLVGASLDKAIAYPVPKLGEKETSHRVWLDSQLFHGGLQTDVTDTEKSFIEDFINAREGTIANQILQRIESKLPVNPALEKMGGVVISPAIRAYMLALLKHLGILHAILDLVMQHDYQLTTTPSASFQLAPELEDQLLKIWQEGRKLRQWVANERRRLLLEIEAKHEENKESENENSNSNTKEMTPEEKDKQEAEKRILEEKCSYQYFCQDIVGKMRFLLNLTPASHFHASEEIALDFDDHSKKRKRTQNTPSLRMSQEESPLKTWKDLFNAWQAVQSLSRSQQLKKSNKKSSQEMLASVPQLITKFATTADASSLQEVIQLRTTRAKHRTLGLNIVYELLGDGSKALNFNSVKQDLLSSLSNTLLSLTEPHEDNQVNRSHYLSGVRSCGLLLEESIRNAFYRIIAMSLSNLKETVDIGVKAAGISMLSDISYLSSEDASALLQLDVLTILHNVAIEANLIKKPNKSDDMVTTIHSLSLSNNVSDYKLREISNLCLRLISYEICNSGLFGIVEPSNNRDRVCESVIDTLFTDLYRAIPLLYFKRDASIKKGSSDTTKEVLEYHKQERFVYESLLQLHLTTLHNSNPFTQSTTSEKVLKLLLHVQHQATPRLQVLSLRILRRMLVGVKAADLSTSEWIQFFAELLDRKDEKMGIIEYLFEMIGDSSADGVDLDNALNTPPAQDYRTAQVMFSIAAERTALLRVLFAHAQWQDSIARYIKESISSIPKLLSVQEKILSYSGGVSELPHYRRAMAALVVLGGSCSDVIVRTGSRVSVKSTHEKGTVVTVDRLASSSRLILDSNINKVITCDIDKLQPLPEVEIDPSSFILTKDLIQAFTVFTKNFKNTEKRAPPPPPEPTPKPPPVKKVTKAKPPPAKKPSIAKISIPKMSLDPWECPSCTFINEPGSLSCSMCTAPRPQLGNSLFQSQVPPEPWECPACTLQNDAYASSCAACTTARPPPPTPVAPANPAPPPEPEPTPDAMEIEPELSASSEKVEEKVEEKIEEPVPEVKETISNVPVIPEAPVDLMLHQIRSAALRAIAHLMQSKENSQVLVNEGLFANLLTMAVQPSQLDEFKSVLQLEILEERLYELLYHRKHSIEEESVQKLVQSEYLKYSPFSKLPLILPSVLDRSSAKRVAFPDGDLTGVVWAKLASDMDFAETNIGLARGNHVIPVSIPVYYFEAEIQSRNDTKATGGLSIAIGIYREGVVLDGLPGNSNSYAYSGEQGQLCHNVGSLRASRVVEREYGDAFTHGDIVGCGWNIKKKEIFFTKNGEYLGPGFDNVNGRFYPVVWIGAENTKVSVNFGQKPFSFDIVSVLPEDFVQSISDMEQKTKVMSSAEIKRSTKADELVVMMGYFPKDLCIIALERCKDDIQYAANWLLENGFKELDRMANETISKTERENREEMDKRIMEQIFEEQRALGQISEDASLTVEDPSQSTSDQPSDDFEEGVLDSREPAARFLDDEIGADVPVQVERQHARVEIQEDLKLEDVTSGMLLHVANGTVDFDIMDLYGKTGLAQEIDINYLRVKLRFFNPETASLHSVWVPFQQLRKPRNMWQDPGVEYKSSKVEELKRAVEEIETALSILKIRRTILNLLPVWPVDVFKNLNQNWKNILDLLKLAGAENLCVSSELKKVTTGNVTSALNTQKSALDVFYDKLALVLKDDAELNPNQIRVLRLPDIEGISSKQEVLASSVGTETLTQLLTEECITHLTLAVKAPLPVVIEESLHPYQNNQDIRKGIHIKGAQKLMIQFDNRCNVHKSDPLTRVAFYRDNEYQDLIAFYRGPVGNNMFDTIMVDSDKIYFRFTSGPGETFWGYKFTVIPVNLRLNDSQALQGLNFEMGYWLLELLLEHGSKALRTQYIKHLYDALIYYIQSSKRSAKSRGVQLLLRILTEIQQAQVYKLIDLDKLRSARKLMEKTYTMEKQQNKLVFSAHLQRLTELVALTRLMELQQSSQKLTDDSWKKFLSQTFPDIRLKIVEAKYGNLKSGKEAILTDAIQQIVDKEHGGGYLFIPSSFSQFPLLSAVSGSKSNQLSITYQFIDIQTGLLIDSGQRISSNGESYTLRPDTWFESITSVIDIIDQISSKNRIPEQIILEALYAKRLREEFHFQIINEYKANGTHAGAAFPCNKTIQSASEFTFYFWIYIDEDPGVAKARSLIVKGNEVMGTRGPAVMLEAGKRNVILQVSTTKNAIEQVETSNEIPLKHWTHVTCVYDGKKLRIYINGLLDGEVGLKGRVLMNSDPFYINKVPTITQNPDSVCDGVKGIFRDLSFQTKAISTEEIQILLTSYSSNDPQPLPPPKPLQITPEEIEYVQKVVQSANLGVDEQLVELVSGMFEDADRDAMFVAPEALVVTQEMLGRYPKLSQFCGQYTDFLKEVRLRFEAVRIFNAKLIPVLPLIDFSQSHLPWTLAHKLLKLKSIILASTKQQLWGKILANTMSGRGRVGVQINRPRALKAKEKGDPEGTRSVFGQLFRQLHFVPPSSLRRSGQAWSVTYLGEGGQDAGGLFRDSISHVCSDLQSPYVPLFMPCPNSRGFGDNQDKWVPIPSATSSLQLAMFAFVGKLMGIAIRGKHSLNLNLPSIVWKQLVGSEITRADLEAIDTFSYKIYDDVMNPESREITPETFAEMNLAFSVTSTDGKDIELIENGKNIKVNWENRQQYIKLVENYRLNEFKAQVEAIKSGLGTIVPNQLLSLFNWQELEMTICGRSDINLDLLKQNTKYSGYSRTDAIVSMFWETMATFSAKEKELFLRFVWGRSRLPLRSEDFDQKFVLMTSPENSDEVLPLSHTCFFQLELPRYSSKEVLHRKLLYAITECREIDTDHAAQNVNWEAEEEENENEVEDE